MQMTSKKKKYTKNEVALMYIEAQSKLNNQIKLNKEIQEHNEKLLEINSDLIKENAAYRDAETRFRIARQQAIDELKILKR